MRKYIGKGAFTKAYLEDDGSVYLKSCCPIKECMAQGWFPESPLFPEVEWIALGEYRMKYYGKTSALKPNLDPDQWKLYKELKAIADNSWGRTFYSLHAQFNKIEEDYARNALKEALDACANYDDEIGFEVSPRNIRTENGKLILLDVFFSKKKLREVMK